MASLLMANKSCEKQAVQEVKKRTPKRIVDVGLITSPQIDLPGGQKFDFQFVINQQIYPVLQNSDAFVFRYRPPFEVPSSEMGPSLDFKRMNISQNDIDLMTRTYGGSQVPMPPSNEVYCFVDLPQYRFWGSINAFELIDKAGVGLGFNSNGKYGIGGLGFNFEVEHYQLDLSMHATNPFQTRTVYASTNVSAKQTRTQVSFSLPISNLVVDPNYYSQTPLAKVSYNALTNAIKDLKGKINEQDWVARVFYPTEHKITISAGKLHNLKVGDIMDIYHEEVFWSGAPCESDVLTLLDGKKVATIELVDVSDEASAGKVIWTSGIPVKMGAKVKINKLVDDTPAVSQKSK